MRREVDDLVRRSRTSEALPIVQRLVEHSPDRGDLLLQWGICLDAKGSWREAAEVLERAYRAGGGDPSRTSYQVAVDWARAGESGRACDWIERCLADRLEDRSSLATEPAFQGLLTDERFRRLAAIPPALESREERWNFDLDHYLEEARRMHASPDRPAFAPTFAAAVESIRSRIGELGDEQIAVELQRVTQMLGDGHSSLSPRPTPTIPFRQIPFTLYFFAEGMTLLQAQGELAPHVGERILTIGGANAQEVLERLRPFVSRDNEQGLLWLGPMYLRSLPILESMGLADQTGATFEFLGADGTVTSVHAKAVQGFRRGLKLEPPPGLDPHDVPLYLRDVDRTYWFEELPEEEALYVQLNNVQNGEGSTLAGFCKELHEVLVETEPRAVIVDLRHDNGGNNTLIWPLVRTLVAYEQGPGAGQVFVITGRGTFSACQNLCNFLDRITHAIFVGEPSSSKPIFVGESTQMVLPFSGLRFSISTRYWADSQAGDVRPFIPVDLPVPVRAADYFSGRDAALEAVFEWLDREP